MRNEERDTYAEIGPFEGSKVEIIHLPSTLRHLGDYTFSYFAATKRCELPEGLETIGALSFDMC